MARKYFGTDGIRGLANGDKLTPELALKVGMAAGHKFVRGDHRNRVVIGKDTRRSGYMIESALTAGFTAVGMDVYFTTLGNQSKRWYGKLRQIEPTPVTVNNVVLYNALFDVENADRALMTQMTAQVFFIVAQAKDAVNQCRWTEHEQLDLAKRL